MATIVGTNNDDKLLGSTDGDEIFAQGGNDLVTADTGRDNIRGGDGDDILYGEGDADRLFGEAGNDRLYGGAYNDRLYGAGGDDLLDGGQGGDIMGGGGGSDTYYVDDLHDEITEDEGASGVDLVIASVDHTLAANVENLQIVGTGLIRGDGNAGDNIITGHAGFSHLVGGAGSDTLLGMDGDDFLIGNDDSDSDLLLGGEGVDIYVVSASDVVIDSGSGDRDLIISGFSWDLGNSPGVERLILTGAPDNAINGVGTDVANELSGNPGNNGLYGLGGNDILLGGDGRDTLHGGTGDDHMDGQAGIDTYYVDSIGDVIVESEGGSVFSSIDFDLLNTPAIHTLSLVGTADVDGSGTAADDELRGNNNSGANILNGRGGNDDLYGGDGDTLIGGGGKDDLHFNSQEGFAYGGRGDDEYWIYTDFSVQRAFENAGEGFDRLSLDVFGVNEGAVFYLPENFESIWIHMEFSEADIHGTNGSEEIGLTGGGRLFGGGGDDYLSHSRGDSDEFFDIVMDGGAGNDRLYGNYESSETMIGGSGADSFILYDKPGYDTIADFEDGQDLMLLSRDTFNVGTGRGELAGRFFRAGTAAADASDRIIYDSATGSLYYDSDGTGAAAQHLVAVIAPHAGVITHADFHTI